jgi:hypothetical protein
MAELSKADQAAQVLLNNFNDRDQRFQDQLRDMQNSISRHTGKGYFHSLKSEKIEGPENPYYLFSVAEDLRALTMLKQHLPVLITDKPADVGLFAMTMIVHMTTLEGQQKAVSMYRDTIQGKEDQFPSLIQKLDRLDQDHAENREEWFKKFGENPHFKTLDLNSALLAAQQTTNTDIKLDPHG